MTECYSARLIRKPQNHKLRRSKQICLEWQASASTENYKYEIILTGQQTSTASCIEMKGRRE